MCLRVQTKFHIKVASEAPHDSHTCAAWVVCGMRVLELSFVINVSAAVDVGKAVAMAAAAAGRHRSGACFDV